MFRFSKLVSKVTEPLNLKGILRARKLFQGNSANISTIKRRSLKNKSNQRKNKIINDNLESQLKESLNNSTVTAVNMTTKDRKSYSTADQSTKSQEEKYGCLQRHWLTTDYDVHTYNDMGLTFTLMSYNILAQDLLELHPYLYSSHKYEHLQWEYRLSMLTREILAARPEILCLQEVQQNHLPMILKQLEKLDFDHIFKKKTGNKTDGCAILYNREIFDLIEGHTVEYQQPNVQYLDRENVALIAKLCVKSRPSACFITSTTHLLYNPRRQDVRLAQIQLLLAELDRVSVVGFYKNGEPKRIPIILTGDFNLQPYSAPYKLITNGSLHYWNLTKRTLEKPMDDRAVLAGNRFLPPQLGITDNCQHFDVVNNKYEGLPRIQNTEIGKYITSNFEDDPDTEAIIASYPGMFSSGHLTHDLKLTSVYDHIKINGQREGTTFQEKWITVDYIFYSKHFTPKTNSICDGYLKLVSRYSLPSSDDCHKLGRIPNAKFGSDHLALGAKFYLRIC